MRSPRSTPVPTPVYPALPPCSAPRPSLFFSFQPSAHRTPPWPLCPGRAAGQFYTPVASMVPVRCAVLSPQSSHCGPSAQRSAMQTSSCSACPSFPSTVQLQFPSCMSCASHLSGLATRCCTIAAPDALLPLSLPTCGFEREMDVFLHWFQGNLLFLFQAAYYVSSRSARWPKLILGLFFSEHSDFLSTFQLRAFLPFLRA